MTRPPGGEGSIARMLMASGAFTSRRFYLGTIGVLLILSLLPHTYCGYGPWLQQLVMTPLALLARPLTTLSHRVQTPAEGPQEWDPDVQEVRAQLRDADLPEEQRRKLLDYLERLRDELREKDGLLLAYQRRSRELEQLNAELQGLQRRLGDAYVYRRASVIGSSSDSSTDNLLIDLGTADGVREGLVVVEGAHLVGRVIQVSRHTSTVKPITARGSLLQVVLVPPQLPPEGLPADRQRTCLLQPLGRGRLADDAVPRSIPVQVGDYARLDDEQGPPGWPREVQGMLVGRVWQVEPDPEDPLRQRVEVRPLVHPFHLDAVTVIVPRPRSDASAEAAP